jgi:hypothetical protein
MRGAFMALAYRRACLVSSACSSDEKDAKVSYLVPTNMATAVLLNPRAWRYLSPESDQAPLGARRTWMGSIEGSGLGVPFFYVVQRGYP